jgi:Cu-Zn family superoxide dismutase
MGNIFSGLPSYISEAIAVINPLMGLNSEKSKYKVSGVVIFRQKPEHVAIHIELQGLKKNAKHGFHIHEPGDLREGCKSCCAHYNPSGTEHGGLTGVGHAGDLGNITSDSKGNCNMSLTSSRFVVDDILGRSIIIHEDEDDLGRGGFEDSKTTGHSGARIACAVIGIGKNSIC